MELSQQTDAALSRLSTGIDPARASQLREAARPAEVSEVAILLGTAFPPFTANHDWQLASYRRLAAEGWERPRSTGRYLLALRRRLSGGEPPMVALRRLAWEEKARVALRELLPLHLGGAPVEVTSQELTCLAEALLQVALNEAMRSAIERLGRPLRQSGELSQFVVVGFGKLGGGELNAGSDVDLMFIYDADDGAGQTPLHEHWVFVARELVRLFEEPTEDGMVWRVDLRLRPYGSQGALAMSLPAAERYYETFGRRWERAALLRARPVAGSAGLAELLVREVMTPFVYRGSVEPHLVETFIDMVERSREQLSDHPERDLKLGEGGIREAEFFIQALQLVWGGRDPHLRTPGSRAGLDRLLARGFVTGREASDINESLWLLRRAEHAVQWVSGLQTHTLPEDGPQLEHLARVLGYENGEAFSAALGSARQLVHSHFSALAPDRPAALGPVRAVVRGLLQPDLYSEERVIELFGAAEAGDHLRSLATHPDSLVGSNTHKRFPGFVERVLRDVADSPDPEAAARGLRSVFGRMMAPGAYVRSLQEEPHALQRLVTVLGTSQLISSALAARPALLDSILFGGQDATTLSPAEVLSAEMESRERSDDPSEDRLSFMGALRRAKMSVVVATGVADLSGELSTRDLTRRLTELAEGSLRMAVDYELSGNAGLATLAVGKLGGADLGYASDLDVLFIYEQSGLADPGEAPMYFSKLAQRVIRLVSEPHGAGPGYELDTRLRPSGAQGLLVTSLSAFARYHKVEGAEEALRPSVMPSGADWERQAMLRARFVAGDAGLGQKALQIARAAAYQGGPPSPEELHRLRMRMEKELGQERPGRFDIKLGRGGLLDVEFAVQWLQMRFGADPRVQATGTMAALEQLHQAGYLSREDHESFHEGYGFVFRLGLRLQLIEGTSESRLQLAHPQLRRVAISLGFRDLVGVTAREALMEHYCRLTGKVRESYLRVLGVSGA